MNLNINPHLTIINKNIDYKKEQVGVNFLTKDGQIQKISAETINPHQGFSAFINWFAEIFLGKSIAEMKLTPESPTLYIKINDLAKILQPSQVKELKAGKTEGVLQEQRVHLKGKMEDIAKKIDGFARTKGISLAGERQHIILQLMNDFGLNAYQEAEKSITQWADAEAKKGKLPTAKPTKQTSIDPATAKQISAQQKEEEKTQATSLYRFATERGYDKGELHHLKRLGDKVTFASLNQTLQNIDSAKDKEIMLRTYIAIGKELKELNSPLSFFKNLFKGQVGYFKRVKKGKERLTHAFAINKKDILVVPNDDPLGKGSFKVVSTAIKLNDLATSFVRVKVQPQSKDPEAATRAIGEVKLEEQLLKHLHKKGKEAKGKTNDDSTCLVPPYECRIISKDKTTKTPKLVMFQQKLGGGDGARLAGAAARQQVHALKDVARGLAYLHSINYVHMDMKPANLLLDGDVKSQTPVKGKVSDLGMTCKKGGQIKGGSFAYLPREAIKPASKNSSIVGGFSDGCVATPEIDSFSLGVTIYELVTGSPLKVGNPPRVFGLLSQAEIDQVLKSEKQKIVNSGDATNKELRSQLLDIAQQLIKQKPADRMTCQSVAEQLNRLIA